MSTRAFFIISFLALTAFPSAALGITDVTFGGSLSADITPRNPGPLTETTIRLTSLDANIAESNIAWFVDGIRTRQGVGERALTFTTGPVGRKTTIEITLTAPDERVITKTITVVPQTVAVVTQANTYAPPLYRGKALPTAQSAVRLTALADFRAGSARISPRSLMYTWYEGSRVLGEGVGKTSVIVESPIPPSEATVRLLVSDQSGELVAERIIPLASRSPSVLMYEEHPTRGTRYERALGSFEISGAEQTFRGEPLFFTLDDPVRFRWFLNGAVAESDPDDLRLVTVRNESGGAGRATLEFVAENTSKLLQSARAALSLLFGSAPFEAL